jgi:hypothetical protein
MKASVETAMTNEEFEAAIMPLYEARPFQSYIIEMNDGSRHLIEKPFAVGFRDGHVTFSTRGRGPRFIHCKNIRRLTTAMAETALH